MPKMPLNPDNKAKNSYEFPKLTLDYGQRARIGLVETEPEWEWTHTMKAPQIVNGRAVMETVKDSKTGESREVMKMDFIGRHICIGDPNVIADKDGIDAAGCPVCAESRNSDAVKPPERRFAMNVLSYQIKKGSFSVQEPFQVELLVWTFSDFQVNKLIDFAEEWKKEGGLQRHDLLLGPCENKQWQKFDINVGPGMAEWLADEDRKKLAVAVYKNNRIEDLSVAIGRRLTSDQIREDLDRVLTRYNIAHNRGGSTSAHEVTSDQSQALSQMDLQGILGNDDEPPRGDPALHEESARHNSGATTKVEEKTDLLDLDALMDL